MISLTRQQAGARASYHDGRTCRSHRPSNLLPLLNLGYNVYSPLEKHVMDESGAAPGSCNRRPRGPSHLGCGLPWLHRLSDPIRQRLLARALQRLFDRRRPLVENWAEYLDGDG